MLSTNQTGDGMRLVDQIAVRNGRTETCRYLSVPGGFGCFEISAVAFLVISRRERVSGMTRKD